jgi:hypothetical protein
VTEVRPPSEPADQPGLCHPDQSHRPAVPLDGRRPGRPGPHVTVPVVLAPAPAGSVRRPASFEALTGPSASGRRGG